MAAASRYTPPTDVSYCEALKAPWGRQILGLSLSAQTLFLRELAKRERIALVIPSRRTMREYGEALRRSGGSALTLKELPAYEALPYPFVSPHMELLQKRSDALAHLLTGESGIVLIPVRSILWPVIPTNTFRERIHSLHVEQPFPLEELIAALVQGGFQERDLVTTMGEFARRGGLVDFYSPDASAPCRVEYFADSIETLRQFDAESQRTIGRIESARLIPARDVLPVKVERANYELKARLRRFIENGEELEEVMASLATDGSFPGMEYCIQALYPGAVPLFAYLKDWKIVLSDEEALKDALWEVEAELKEKPPFASMEQDESGLSSGSTWENLATHADISFGSLGSASENEQIRVSCSRLTRGRGDLKDLVSRLRKRQKEGLRPVIVLSTDDMVDEIQDFLEESNEPVTRISPSEVFGLPASWPKNQIYLVKDRLVEGFALAKDQLALYTEREIFGVRRRIATRPSKARYFSTDFRDLRVGDYVVHIDYGIGQFTDLVKTAIDAREQEFMLLTYRGDARLYVPIDRLDLLHKYSSTDELTPPLDELGSRRWQRAKERVKRSVRHLARELLELYAIRETSDGHSFLEESPWDEDFESDFPYEETLDQIRAIEETRRDMETPKTMDRLLCGDVGFGKTEVAMRAALKAVADGKQVAFLCPTTVLAFQHFQTFRSRFSQFPIECQMLSRFLTPKEQRGIIDRTAKGKVDILIGTHRLLSNDVRFSDLGFLVVDEEQRFGVAHKEKLKQLRREVDVLTMTATPIPRTLYMSLTGIRDMSVIETPPKNRLAIQTNIIPFDEEIIRGAIRYELLRDGQVYFVHNEVRSIDEMALRIRQICPEVKMCIAHGQMDEMALETTMMDFSQGKYNLLLCTTIIENGIDIPRANTIFIDNAYKFGMAQLYQLRGRVGRSSRKAYAYLIVPPKKRLTPEARQRLAALQEFSSLGSGFRIAAADLEVRGAGNVLGEEQSGHIATVGFELYCKLLEETARELRGEILPEGYQSTIDLGKQVAIPEAFLGDANQRLMLYKKIASVDDPEKIDGLREELRDVYGHYPREVDRLLQAAQIRLKAQALRIERVEMREGGVRLTFDSRPVFTPKEAMRLAGEQYELQSPSPSELFLPSTGDLAEAVDSLLSSLLLASDERDKEA